MFLENLYDANSFRNFPVYGKRTHKRSYFFPSPLRHERQTPLSDISGFPHKLHFSPVAQATPERHCPQSPYRISLMPVKAPPHRGQTAGKKKSFAQKSKCLIKLIPLIRREYTGRFSEAGKRFRILTVLKMVL